MQIKHKVLAGAVFAVFLPVMAHAQMTGVPPINQSSIMTDEEKTAAANAKAAQAGAAAGTETAAQEPEAAPEVREALVVVRFNQSRVYFERAIAQAVASARSIKPLVTFDVISFEPAEGAPSRAAQTRANERYETNLRDVVKALQKQGVPDANIAVRRESASVMDQEVHLFVR